MSAIISKFAGPAILFVLIFISGFWLSHLGKPYSALFFNVHKLIALAGVIFLGLVIYQARAAAQLDALAIAALVFTAICCLLMIITGGLQNIDPPLPAWLGVVHRIFPYVTMVAGIGAISLLFLRGQSWVEW